MENLQEDLTSEWLKNAYRKKASYFTRTRLFTFSTVLTIEINIISKSLSVAVSKFFGLFNGLNKEKDGSKQAFSKARSHIKWEVYQKLNNRFIERYYSDDEYIQYKGKYLILATDGTTYELPYTSELLKEFNTCSNDKGASCCRAQGVKIYDVLNQLTITTTFAPYSAGKGKGASEQELFEKCLNRIPDLINPKEHNILLLGDMYYPSFYYFHELPYQGYNFIFRCSPTFCKEIKAIAASKSEDQDSWLTIDLTKYRRMTHTSARRINFDRNSNKQVANVEVRCIKIEIHKDEFMYLLTNIGVDGLNTKELKELYSLRWQEEVSFDTDKNKIEIENFSSKKPNGIRQDFYARVLTMNIAQLLIGDAQQELIEEQAMKSNKYDYQINKSVAIGLIKDELPKLLLLEESAAVWADRLIKKILKRREPIRPGRSFPRKKKHKLKYHITQRRVT